MAFGIGDSLVTKLAGNNGSARNRNLTFIFNVAAKLAEPAPLRVANCTARLPCKCFGQAISVLGKKSFKY